MTFPYIGANGLFTRVGSHGGLVNSIEAFIGSANLSAANIESIGLGVDHIASEYAAPDLNLIGGLYAARDSYRGVHGPMLTYLQNLAQTTLIQMVNEFSPLSAQTLPVAMQFLVNQMTTDAQTVSKPTVAATPTAGTNIGGGVLTASVLGPNGKQLDYVFAETISALCTADAQGTATAGQEQFTVAGPLNETNPLAFDWPLYSGCSTTLNAVDALQDNAGGNLSQNGSFKQWTNVAVGPDNWLILDPGAGVGTTIVQATGGNVYKGSSGIGFVGDSSHTPSISQPFNAALSTAGNAGGTPAVLLPLTQYALNLFLKSSVVPAAGVLTIELTDGTNTVVNDAAGNPNSVAIALSATTTGFVAHNVYFRTPAVIPATGFRLRIRVTTPISTGTTLYFGHEALQLASQLYTGGPFAAVFSGTPNFIQLDSFNLAVANNFSSKWQLLAERMFGMRALGLQFPSGGAPTILDSLIA